MDINRWWKRGPKLLTAGSMDDIDNVVAGNNFQVGYLGRMDIDEDEDCDFNETAGKFVGQYSPNSLTKLLHFDLVIDSMSVEIIDRHAHDVPKVIFVVPLSNVKNALFRKGCQKYADICIFVAQNESECSLKAHVLLCKNPETAENIFKSFERAFAVRSDMDRNNTVTNLRRS